MKNAHYEFAEKRRQAILDYLNTHGPDTSWFIAAATGIKDTSIHNLLLKLVEYGEVIREGRRYTAIARITVTADTIMASKITKSKASEIRRKAEAKRPPQLMQGRSTIYALLDQVRPSVDSPRRNSPGGCCSSIEGVF